MNDDAQKIIEDQKQLVSTLYERSNTYNMVIFAIGYAGFFSILALVKDHISSIYAIWAALFISISIAALVFFEVYKMIYSSWLISSWKKELIDIKPGQQYDFIKRWNTFRFRIETAEIWHIRIWIVQLCIVIPTGLVASGIMLWSFISQLLKFYWP